MKNRFVISVALAGALAVASVAGAETIRAVSGFGADHPIAVSVYPEVGARMEEFTDGAWSLEDTPAGITSPIGMSTALREGDIDFGALVLPYFSAEFAEAALPSELSVLGDNSQAISAAVTEYVATCAECQAEFTGTGKVYLGSDATPPYNLLTAQPIRSVDDLAGLRIRTGAPLYATFVKDLRGVVVQLPSSDLPDALGRGMVAGTFDGNQEIMVHRLGEPINYVTPRGAPRLRARRNTASSRASTSFSPRPKPRATSRGSNSLKWTRA